VPSFEMLPRNFGPWIGSRIDDWLEVWLAGTLLFDLSRGLPAKGAAVGCLTAQRLFQGFNDGRILANDVSETFSNRADSNRCRPHVGDG
jgi:hypothetical protein